MAIARHRRVDEGLYEAHWRCTSYSYSNRYSDCAEVDQTTVLVPVLYQGLSMPS